MSAGKKTAILSIYLIMAALLALGPSLTTKSQSGPRPAESVIPETDGRPIFLNFYSDSCQVCGILAPEIEKLEREFGDRIQFIKIDANAPESEMLVTEFEVSGLPSFFWITAEGHLFDAQSGLVPAETIRATLEGLLAHKEENVPAMPPTDIPKK